MIEIIKGLSVNHLRDTLLRLYKSFIRLHLDYRDIAITCVIQRTSWEHLYHELGSESLLSWWWGHNLSFFYEIVNRCAWECLADYININDNRAYKTTALKYNNIKRFGTKTEISNNHFSIFVLMNSRSQKF